MSKSIVLWVENEPEKLDVFRRNIEDDDTIELVIRRDAQSAVQFLNENFESLSAAILDVESFVDPDSQLEKESSFGIVERAIAKLIGTGRNSIQYFAFTGKGKYLREEENFEEYHQCPVFSKSSQTVEAQNYLKKIVKNHHNTQIKNRFEPAFRVFQSVDGKDPILKPTYEQLVINLISAWDDYRLRNSSLFFGVIRPICEDMISHLVFLGVIPMDIKKWNHKSEHFASLSEQYPDELPSYIARAFHTIFDVCPEGVHSCPLFDDVNSGKTPFLLQSLSYELLNLLSWISDFSATHPDYHSNRRHFVLKQPIHRYQNNNINKKPDLTKR